MRHSMGLLLAGVLIAGGCSESGLSPRESSATMPRFLDTLYDMKAGQAVATPSVMSAPIKISVAQIGELVPPETLVERLRTEKATFAEVQTLHSTGFSPTFAYNFRDSEENQLSRAKIARDTEVDSLKRTMGMARDQGSTHLILLGGNIDMSKTSTAASVFDLTIVGAFVVPSSVIKSDGKGVAAIVDLKSERVVHVSTVTKQRTSLAATLNADDESQEVQRKTRDDLIKLLGDQIVEDVKGLEARRP